MLEILRPGLLTTVQDNGRHSYQRFGVPVAGAMDKFALGLANILVGNHPYTEALEATLLGPKLRFGVPNIFAVCGGSFENTLNGTAIENNRAYCANAGDVLDIGAAVTGSRAMIAFCGGLEAQSIMDSKSTYIKGGIGGIHGRALKKGDTIGFAAPACDLPNMTMRFVPRDFGIQYSHEPVIRVIMGPQDDYFSDEGKRTFLSGEYEVTHENDRMGYRLSGRDIQRKEGMDGNIISDGVSYGAIQVPHTQPIIMMADRQTTGGYPKIANAVAVDLPLIAQLRTGDKMRFTEIDIHQAQRLYLGRRELLVRLWHHFNDDHIIWRSSTRVRVEQNQYDVLISEIDNF